MRKLMTLIKADLRQIFRDSTLTLFLFIPFLITAAVRFYVPSLTEQFPILSDYHTVIMMGAGIQTAVMFGFIIAFIILDEKDENIMLAIRVLPISSNYFLGYRLIFAAMFSFFGAWFTIEFSGIAYPGKLNAMLLSMSYALASPFIALVVSTFAQNKVEGMAYFKGIDLVLMLPLIGFVIEGIWGYLFVLIPTYWTFLLFKESNSNQDVFVCFAIGMAYYMVLLFILFKAFKKKVFQKS